MNHKDYRHLLAYVATLLLLLGCAESEKITEDKPTTEPRAIGFSIDVSQDWYAQNPGTRAILERSQPRHIEMQCSDGSTAYLLETTRTGIDKPLSSLQVSEVPSADGLETRASLVGTDRSGMGSFSSFCYKSDGTAHYLNEQTSNTGALSSKKYWPDGETSLRFYAVHPYDASHFTTSSATALSYAFTSSADVEAQTDLMYASTDLVSYNDATSKQYISLHFKHALTAVRFKLGNSNSNFGKTIKYIKLKNVYTSGTLTLPSTSTDNTTDASATWTSLGTQTDVMLDNIGFVANASTAGHIITKGGKTEYFLMIPQDLNGVGIEIGFTDDTKFAATLTSGSWTGGTTVQYTISDATLDWTYQFEVNATSAGFSSSNPLAFTDTETGNFSVASYRYLKGTSKTDPSVTNVPWKISKIEYSENNGSTWTEGTPAWLLSPALNSGGEGSVAAVTGTATVDAASYIEETCSLKIERDASLKNDVNRKGDDARYDLSNPTGAADGMTTANCYVISGYGHYKLPLVYGNAIKNSAVNSSSYTSGAASGNSYVLYTFLNYTGAAITNPWIQESGGVPTSASLVWSDVSADVVTFPATGTITTENVTIGGASQEIYYLNFDIAKEKIESGNAVVAVKDGSGTVMWSWHLWFAPADVLNVISFNNSSDQVQKFTTESLGQKMPSSRGSTYTTPRLVRLTFLQKENGNTSTNTATVTIYQKNGSSGIPASTTLYQWGRKDALPGVPYDTGTGSDASNIGGGTIGKSVYGSFTKNTAGKKTYSYAIQHPSEFITYLGDWHGDTDSPVTVYNAWAADNTGNSSGYATSSVVKTVYDPCPPGFKMPGANAFTGFSTSNGSWTTLYFGVPIYAGYTFTKNSASVFFPAAGTRNFSGGLLYYVGSYGIYWSAVPYDALNGWSLLFNSGYVDAQIGSSRAFGRSVRPVQE